MPLWRILDNTLFKSYHRDNCTCGSQAFIVTFRDVARTFKGGSPADTNNYDRFDAPIVLNTREV